MLYCPNPAENAILSNFLKSKLNKVTYLRAIAKFLDYNTAIFIGILEKSLRDLGGAKKIALYLKLRFLTKVITA